MDAHTLAIDVEPFEAKHVGYQPQRVGELLLRGDHGDQRPFGERPVTDLPAARRADAARLTGRERREVVVVDVPLRVLEIERVDHLVHPKHPERRDVQRLRVATLEQRRSVSPRQQPDVRGERTDVLRPAAVQPDAVRDHALAHDLLLERLPGRRELLASLGEGLLPQHLRQVRLGLVLEGRHVGLALFPVGHERGQDLVLREGLERLPEIVLVQRVRLEVRRLHADRREELLLELDDLGDDFLRPLEALGDDLLGGRGGALTGREERPGHVGRLALDHQDVDPALVVLRAGHDDVEGRLVELLERGVHGPLSADQAEADGADRTVERQAGDPDRERRRVHRGDVVRVGHVDRQDRDDDLDLVPVALAERGPQGTVDQPCGEDRRFGRSSFATEEAAGDLAPRVHPLLDVDREREEVDPLAGGGADARGEHHRVAVASDGGAVGELRERAGLEEQILGADLP